MKLLLTTLLIVCLIAVAVVAQEAVSVNAVGYTKIDIGPQKLALVSVDFESFTNSTINELIGNQLSGASLAWVWSRTNSTYIPFSLGRGGWTPNPGPTILRGDAFWLYNGSATVTSSVCILGEVPSESIGITNTVVLNCNGINALGYPYPSAEYWTNTALAKNATTGNLWLWDTVNQTYLPYSVGRGGWNTPPGQKIKPGEAFWLQSDSTTNWSSPKPYTIY